MHFFYELLIVNEFEVIIHFGFFAKYSLGFKIDNVNLEFIRNYFYFQKYSVNFTFSIDFVFFIFTASLFDLPMTI